jgi:hypothetical protein
MRQKRLSYANVMATIAVFIALGGASYAATKLPKNSVGAKQLKKNAVTGVKVKDGSLAGNDIDASTLGQVPSANHAGSAATATIAANAENLGGVAASSYVKAGLEPVHIVGQAGEPAFENTAKNSDAIFEEVGFYRDLSGIVHLQGVLEYLDESKIDQPAFTLPPEFSPKKAVLFNRSIDPAVPEVLIEPNGNVVLHKTPEASLGSVMFRTD